MLCVYYTLHAASVAAAAAFFSCIVIQEGRQSDQIISWAVALAVFRPRLTTYNSDYDYDVDNALALGESHLRRLKLRISESGVKC